MGEKKRTEIIWKFVVPVGQPEEGHVVKIYPLEALVALAREDTERIS